MLVDLEENKDYKNWADKFKQDGGKPDFSKYIIHLVYKDSNSEPKHIKNGIHLTLKSLRENKE